MPLNRSPKGTNQHATAVRIYDITNIDTGSCESSGNELMIQESVLEKTRVHGRTLTLSPNQQQKNNKRKCRKPRKVYSLCETIAKRTTTGRCYFGGNAINRPPTRNGRPAAPGQVQQSDTRNNKSESVYGATHF